MFSFDLGSLHHGQMRPNLKVLTTRLLSPAGRAGDYKTHSVRVCGGACVRVLLSVCHAFIKGCTSHWLFLLGLFNVFDDLIAYVLSFDAVISHLGP